jgi:magnesium chelatase family protein
VRERVEKARAVQRRRFAQHPGVHCNAQLSGPALRRLAAATEGARTWLARFIEVKELSARAHDRILKLGRTLADLQGDERVTEAHLLAASQLRCLDRRVEEAPGLQRLTPLQLARKAALQRVPGNVPEELPREGT